MHGTRARWDETRILSIRREGGVPGGCALPGTSRDAVAWQVVFAPPRKGMRLFCNWRAVHGNMSTRGSFCKTVSGNSRLVA